MGLRDIERKLKKKSAYQVHDAEMMLQELDSLIENVEEMKKQLKKFEKKHGKELKSNKDYYQKVSHLRDELGLPSEIGVYEWRESPSFMERLKGSGYFDQLGNEILELSNEIKGRTGGMISLAELVLNINRSRPGKLVPAKDVKKAIDNLSDARVIRKPRELPSGVLIVEFTSIELSGDQQRVLDLAARHGFLTREKLLMFTSWPTERVNRVLDDLISQGIVMKDESYHEGTKYWFPGLGD